MYFPIQSKCIRSCCARLSTYGIYIEVDSEQIAFCQSASVDICIDWSLPDFNQCSMVSISIKIIRLLLRSLRVAYIPSIIDSWMQEPATSNAHFSVMFIMYAIHGCSPPTNRFFASCCWFGRLSSPNYSIGIKANVLKSYGLPHRPQLDPHTLSSLSIPSNSSINSDAFH